MKKTTLALAAMAALTLGSGYAAAQPMQGHEPHPEIDAAISDLQSAKHHLELANHDFKGHRVKALKLVDGALDELGLALHADQH